MLDLSQRVVAALRERVSLLPALADWLARSFAEGVSISALSLPRGNGKSWLAGQVAALAMAPGSCLWRPGLEVLIVAASMNQARIIHKFFRAAMEGVEGIRHLDSGQRIESLHPETQTRLRVLSSDPRRAMGLSQYSLILCDEPGAWEVRAGAQMWEALETSIGKVPGQRILLCGTLAPAPAESWWPQMIADGDGDGVRVTVLRGDRALAWDDPGNVASCNPMAAVNPALRGAIRRELEAARKHSTKVRQFQAYRLNWHVNTSANMLLELSDWQAVEARAVPARRGRAIVGFDAGETRSWSGAWCMWESGRSECFALCPGIPDIATRERQDAQPEGLYQGLAAEGALIVDTGRKRARPEVLIDHLLAIGIVPAAMYADRFMHELLTDHVRGRWPVHKRILMWSHATDDICAFRTLALDGPLSIAPESRRLATVSLANATCETDTSGNIRPIKRDKARSRDDVAISGIMAAGAFQRAARKRPSARIRLVG